MHNALMIACIRSDTENMQQVGNTSLP